MAPGQGTQGPRVAAGVAPGQGEPRGLNPAPLTGRALQAGSGRGEWTLGLPRTQRGEPGLSWLTWDRDSGWGWAGPCGQLSDGLLSPGPGPRALLQVI